MGHRVVPVFLGMARISGLPALVYLVIIFGHDSHPLRAPSSVLWSLHMSSSTCGRVVHGSHSPWPDIAPIAASACEGRTDTRLADHSSGNNPSRPNAFSALRAFVITFPGTIRSDFYWLSHTAHALEALGFHWTVVKWIFQLADPFGDPWVIVNNGQAGSHWFLPPLSTRWLDNYLNKNPDW